MMEILRSVGIQEACDLWRSFLTLPFFKLADLNCLSLRRQINRICPSESLCLSLQESVSKWFSVNRMLDLFSHGHTDADGMPHIYLRWYLRTYDLEICLWAFQRWVFAWSHRCSCSVCKWKCMKPGHAKAFTALRFLELFLLGCVWYRPRNCLRNHVGAGRNLSWCQALMYSSASVSIWMQNV